MGLTSLKVRKFTTFDFPKSWLIIVDPSLNPYITFEFMEIGFTQLLERWRAHFLVICICIIIYLYQCPCIHITHESMRIQLFKFKGVK